jgi:zinc transport system ATP-binding protein
MSPRPASIKDVSFSYGENQILSNISFDVEEGDLLGIIGPNGGGKTTLLLIMLGLLEPDSGSARIFGKKPDSGREKIGYVPQVAHFERDFPITVSEVVVSGRLGNREIGEPFNENDEKIADKMLDRVGMVKFSNRQISQLSGGQLQRVLLARALVCEPGLLLLDEPLSSIDPDTQKSFYELLGELKKDMAIVMVTHDITAAAAYFDKLACLNVKLFYHGKTKEGIKHLEDTYECPIEMIAHGIPHRVLGRHEHD